jgi:hypothetical protein
MIAETPRLTPIFGTSIALMALGAAFLSLARYQMVRDSIS